MNYHRKRYTLDFRSVSSKKKKEKRRRNI